MQAFQRIPVVYRAFLHNYAFHEVQVARELFRPVAFDNDVGHLFTTFLTLP